MPTDYKSCDVNELLKDSVCFQWCASEEEMVAVDLVVRAAELAAVGGTDYTGTGGLTTLLNDAKAWVGNGTLNGTNRYALEAYIDWLNAVNNGASPSLTAGSLLTMAMQFRSLDPATKRNLALFLKCRLNSLDQP